MSRAIYPGSFDPVTLGHLNIIERLSGCFEHLTVLVASSDNKGYLFTLEEREKLMKAEVKGMKNVDVQSFSGLTVDFARKNKATVIVRGLRAVADFDYEMAIAHMNKSMAEDIETMIVFADPRYSFVSANLLKEVTRHGADVSQFVTSGVQKALKKKLSERSKK